MEEGYPGELKVRAVYSLPDTNELRLDLYAETDRTTIVNLTGHSYFNLKGHDGGPITGHELKINSAHQKLAYFRG
jgi:aldose 1-epimerase